MKKLLQINPVVRISTSTGRIMQEIGELAIANGWESFIAYSGGRDGIKPCKSQLVPVGNRLSVAWHGVVTRLFDRHGLASTRATRKLIKQIEEIKPDIIHIHNIHGYFLNYKVLFDYLSKINTSVVWTVHDCWLYTGHCFYYSYARCNRWESGCSNCPQKREFPASMLCDRSRQNYIDKREAFTSIPGSRMMIVPVSQWMKNEMSRSFLKDCRFRVIHNGININIFQPCGDGDVRERYGLGTKKIILGVASVWSREKGIDDFVKMSSMLADDEVIVMVGVDDAAKAALPSNIVTIKRTSNIEQLAALYSAATAFVNPTWQDNYPTVNLEAISCGTPVITYRTGGSIEAVTPETGFVVGQGDVEGLLKAFRKIKDAGKEAYSEACRAYAVAHFNKEDRYVDYIKLYEELMSANE